MEKSFFPREVSAAEMTRGLSLAAVPALQGFELTYMKSGAEQVFSAMFDAPLLAVWRYGLGRTAAFTSDLGGRWSGLAFVERVPKVRLPARPMDREAVGLSLLHPRMEITHGRATLSVDAYDPLGGFVNGLEVKGILVQPGGARSEVSVPQTAPGLYEASFPAEEVGDYTLTLAARSGDVELSPLTVGTSVAYSEEYALQGPDRDMLDRLASETGGRVISSLDDAAGLAALLRREAGPSAAGNEAWRFFLLAAVVLFFADIASRRLGALRELLGRVFARVRSLRGKPALSSDELPASLPASATRSAPGPRRGFPELRGRESWTRSLPPTSIWHACAAVARRKTSTKKGRACMMARAAARRGALLTHGAAGPAWPLFRTQTPHTYRKRVDCPKTCTSRFFSMLGCGACGSGAVGARGVA